MQYGLLNYDNLGRRPQGTLSHWMTYSGTLMLVICGSVARLLFDQRDRVWAALVMPALLVALGLTFTRSAWVGVFAGVGVLFLLKDCRLDRRAADRGGRARRAGAGRASPRAPTRCST